MMLASCAEENTSIPEAQPEPPLYPLVVGNQWTYQRSFSVEFVSLSGSVVPPPRRLEATGTRRLTGTEQRFGRNYVIEHEVMVSDSMTDTVQTWMRYRQDETGLYSADVPVNEPPAVGPVAATDADQSAVTGENEATILAYPLRVGATWVVRRGPARVTATVEARDTIELDLGRFATYRIRVLSEISGPSDVTLWWYGPCGLLRRLVHTEVLAIDAGTGDTTLVVTEDEAVLEGLSLPEQTRCPPPAGRYHPGF
jgi:hypothetical protein